MAAQVTSIDILVTPTRRNGPDVFCRIEPANTASSQFVKGQVIFLPMNREFLLNFDLRAGQGPQLQWDSANPFRAEQNQCPGPETPMDGQFTVGALSGNQLTVGSSAQSTDSVVHYRLNFVQGGSNASCDPIIINGGETSPVIDDGISGSVILAATLAVVAIIALIVWLT